MSFKPEFQTNGDPKWYDNALVFATQEEAQQSADDTYANWTLCTARRVVTSSMPPNYAYVDGLLQEVKHKIDVIALMKIHAADSGFAPAGVIYKPRDDMRIAIPLVEELIAAAEETLDCPPESIVVAFNRLAKALAAVQS